LKAAYPQRQAATRSLLQEATTARLPVLLAGNNNAGDSPACHSLYINNALSTLILTENKAFSTISIWYYIYVICSRDKQVNTFSLISDSELSLLDFAAQEESYALKCNQITTTREIEDTKRHTHRKGEDEKYNTILSNRRYEDESVKLKREAEDNLLRDIEKMIEYRELASDHKLLRGTQN
jgi:hypothetical protein